MDDNLYEQTGTPVVFVALSSLGHTCG
jgi:hypothetical protein